MKSTIIPPPVPDRTLMTRAVQAAITDVRTNPERGACLPYMMDMYAPTSDSDLALSYEDWPLLLAEFWTSCEFFQDWIWELRATLPTHGPVREMMTSEECAFHEALPETLTVYRGQDAEWEPGMCWTLDEEVANWFAVRFSRKEPVVIRATVSKRKVLAVMLGRGEKEIITVDANVLSKYPANEARATEYFRRLRLQQEKEFQT